MDLTHPQLFLMLPRHRQHFTHIFRKPQLSQSLVDMLCRYRLFAFFLGDLVGFGRYEGYELDGAVDQEVAGIFAEGEAGFVAKNIGNDFLNRGC